MPFAGQRILAADFDGSATDVDATDVTGFTDTGGFVAGTPVVGCTFVAPTSGTVDVFVYARFESNSAGVRAIVSFAVREGSVIGSGSAVSAASNNKSLQTPTDASGGGNQRTAGTVFETVSGLTVGATYNVQVEHQMETAGNGDIFDRSVTVIPKP